jgi:hypothetical protein
MTTSKVVTTRFSREDYDAIKLMADAEGVSLSQWVRARCVDAKDCEAQLADVYAKRIDDLERKLIALGDENEMLRKESGLRVPRRGRRAADASEALRLNLTRAEKLRLRECADV